MTGKKRERPFGTRFNTVAASDAQQPVNGPLLLHALDRQRAGGTFPGAHRAVYAVIPGENQLAAGAGESAARLEGVARGGRFLERPFQGEPSHLANPFWPATCESSQLRSFTRWTAENAQPVSHGGGVRPSSGAETQTRPRF